MFGQFFWAKEPLCQVTLCPPNEKFPADNQYEENDEYIVCTEGYILNLTALCEAHAVSGIVELLRGFCKTGFWEGFLQLKGSFVVCVFEKATGKAYLGNDLLSKRPLYYHVREDGLTFSTSFASLVDALQERGVHLTPDRLAFSSMLGTGVLFGNLTYANEIHFLPPFTALEVHRGCVEKSFPLPVPRQDMGEEDILSELDRLFEAAVALQFTKNQENGYDNVTTLSAGMDSRAVFLYGARRYSQRCFTYSQEGSMEQQTALALAEAYRCPILYRNMSGGQFLKNRQPRIEANEAMTFYDGTTVLQDALREQNCQAMGLIHTGLGGGEIMGDICVKNSGEARAHRARRIGCDDTAQAARLEALFGEAKDYNQFLNLADLRVCTAFMRVAAPFAEAASPFLEEDFFCFALQLDPALRMGRHLYKQWMLRYAPNPYPYAYCFGPLTQPAWLSFCKKAWARLATRLLGKSKYDMNPMSYWLAKDPAIANRMAEMYAADKACFPEADPRLLSRIEKAAFSRSLEERSFGLTASWALARYFGRKAL